MSFGVSLITLVGFVVIVYHYWERLTGYETAQARRWFRIWLCQGVVIPSLAWIACNIGFSSRFPPLMVEVELAQTAGGFWLPALLRVTAPALLIIGSYWAALTFGWWLWTFLKVHLEHRDRIKTILRWWSIVFLPYTIGIIWIFGLRGLGFGLMVWLFPIAHSACGLLEQETRTKTSPVYSRAIAYLKFGKYADAETAVIQELERCEDDFNGWMMLAELYANQFNDVAEAERTVRELCQQPKTSPPNVAVALHRLADWQLKLRDDPAAARRALEEICSRFPGSHLSRMASLRINQLPRTREELIHQREGRTIHLPTYESPPGTGREPFTPGSHPTA